MPARSYYLNDSGTIETGLSAAQMSEALNSGRGLLWVDIAETTKDDGELLSGVFKFHRLAIEDCVEPDIHPPKIDDYGDYLFMLVHGINHSSNASEVVETAELELFLGPNYVVSNHNFPLYSVEEVVHEVQTSGKPLQRGPDFLTYLLVDALVDNILPAIDYLSDIADGIEEQALATSDPATLESIHRLRRSIRNVHRTTIPQRELLNRLSRGDYPLVRPPTRVYFRDVYDHLVRIDDLNMNIRESADNAITTYLSAVANRQNETMKVLAVVGAIFLPLTLLAGVYGMNFEHMPELGWRYSYFFVVGFMLAVIIAALVMFWKRGWFRPQPLPADILRPFTVDKNRLRGHASRSEQSHSDSGASTVPVWAPDTSPGLDGSDDRP
ncbi:MAG: magnesium/cobalt transporter CorA [Dehalococcoidia bacterium]|nr:magnesium/cobalt transporter CorA [Dehalococcoidia bacterium]